MRRWTRHIQAFHTPIPLRMEARNLIPSAVLVVLISVAPSGPVEAQTQLIETKDAVFLLQSPPPLLALPALGWTDGVDTPSLDSPSTRSAFVLTQTWEAHQPNTASLNNERWMLRYTTPIQTPLAIHRPDSQTSTMAVVWRHDWTAVHETSPSGLEFSLSPYAGMDWTDNGSAAVAGATVRIGRGLNRLAPDGGQRFGETARWYLFASGSKRAVGYNFTRHRDGGLATAGLSQDRGHAMGDAAIGVAWRKGPMQTSVGLVYREVEIDGLRGYNGLRTDVDEGVLAFQFSIRPQ